MGKQFQKKGTSYHAPRNRKGSKTTPESGSSREERKAELAAEAVQAVAEAEHAELTQSVALPAEESAGGLDALVSKFLPDVEKAIEPIAEEAHSKFEECQFQTGKDRLSIIAVRVIRKTIKELEDNPESCLGQIVTDIRALEREMNETVEIDGLRVPAAVARPRLKLALDALRDDKQRAHKQVSAVICGFYKLDPDCAHEVMRKFERDSDVRVQNAQKGHK